LRPAGIFASNTKPCQTKTNAYEKGNIMTTAGASGQLNKQISQQTKTTSNMDKSLKTNNLIFKNNLITNN